VELSFLTANWTRSNNWAQYHSTGTQHFWSTLILFSSEIKCSARFAHEQTNVGISLLASNRIFSHGSPCSFISHFILPLYIYSLLSEKCEWTCKNFFSLHHLSTTKYMKTIYLFFNQYCFFANFGCVWSWVF